MAYDISVETIRQARERIRGYVRHTPLAPLPNLTSDAPPNLRLKLENLQVVGSFKPRGVFNTLLQLDDAARQRGVVAASGGNHGVALAYGAYRLGIPAIVYLPLSASADRVARVKVWGAELVQYGTVWDDTHAEATRRAAAEGMTYVHPFDADNTIAGQGTLGLELLDDVPDLDLALISIGGGGLIGGMAAAIKQTKPSVRIIGVEPVGAPSLKHSLDLGRLEPLPEVRTIADTLAPRAVSQRTLDLAQKYVDEVVLVEDAAMIDAQRWLWLHYNQLVEPAAVAVIAALPQVNLQAYNHPVALICGGNAAADPIWQSYEALGIQKGSIPPKA
ncbi:MAG: pyridoxal-phosphate dependent enzyme [Chloroflexi bacterium]|nr:pyridoxal-phosphate dependent enzyme [Chloroflexota bacterium]